MAIPSPLETEFVVASSLEVRSWSFGIVSLPRESLASFDDHVPNTLHDQRIFGPVHDFTCPCGRYSTSHYKGMICDRCGFKVAPRACRASRFGHIEFSVPIPHPFADDKELECFPVVPAALWASPGGRQLPDLYDRLVASTTRQLPADIEKLVAEIVNELIPIVVLAHEWRLADSAILARGLALVRVADDEDSPRYCRECGYLLTGLMRTQCPGCGTQIL